MFVYPLSAPRLELDLQRYAALLEMADVVSRHHEPVALFRDLVPALRAVVPFDFLNFALHNPFLKIMKLYVWEGPDAPLTPMEVPVDEAAIGWVWQHQEPLTIDDLQFESRFQHGLAWLRGYDLRSYCVFPLTAPQGRLGALGFGAGGRLRLPLTTSSF